MVDWHFAKQRPDHVDDETTVAKNFARESRLLVGVFVREFFQNVLDARVNKSGGQFVTPHVRISIACAENGLSSADLVTLHDGLHDHLIQAGHEPELWDDTRANALILEELGTSGLIGVTNNSRAKGADERWSNFWFGEGQRTKRGASLGRAGQGKITYHLISGTQAVFALSNQHNGASGLLFGKCIVQRTHSINGQDYLRHGYWPETDQSDQPLPSQNAKDIGFVRSAFGLTRDGEPGTSWMIPYVDTDIFTKEGLISEILRDFFFSIMAGDLTVDVMGTIINQGTVRDVIATTPINDLPEEFVEFLEEAITVPNNDPGFITAKPVWYGSNAESPMRDAALAEDDLQKARDLLDNQRMIAVRLPLRVAPAIGNTIESEICIFLKKPDHLTKTEELYVRSGLVIGEEQHLRNAPGSFYGLMHAKHPVISEFLGFAEEASHMKWNTREKEVVDRYKNVMATVASVRHSLPKLAKLLLGHTSGRHDDALIEFLSIPAPGSGRKAKTTKKRGKSGREGGGEGPKRPPAPFRVSQSGSQWRLSPSPSASELEYPLQLRIDLAYATMPGEGNPFKVYHPFEFDLSNESAHTIAVASGRVNVRDLNRLEVELRDENFEIVVDGFTEHALKSRIVGFASDGGET